MANSHIPFKQRFWNAVAKAGDTECWLWTASVNGSDAKWKYGQISLNYKKLKAHRVSYEIANGPVPEGLCVLHRCDNPVCVNPRHLFLGTFKDNTADMYRKGRNPDRRGMKSATSRLTDADVFAIRASTNRVGVIARQFDVPSSLVSNIRNGKAWKHL